MQGQSRPKMNVEYLKAIRVPNNLWGVEDDVCSIATFSLLNDFFIYDTENHTNK